MAEVQHPGARLKLDYLDPLGISPAELARGLGIHRSRITRLIQGKIPVTLDTACRLGLFFDVPPRWWLQMQMEYDLATAPDLSEAVTPWTYLDEALVGPKRARRLRPSAQSSSPQVWTVATGLSEAQLQEMRQTAAGSSRATSVRHVRRADGSVALEVSE